MCTFVDRHLVRGHKGRNSACGDAATRPSTSRNSSNSCSAASWRRIRMCCSRAASQSGVSMASISGALCENMTFVIGRSFQDTRGRSTSTSEALYVRCSATRRASIPDRLRTTRVARARQDGWSHVRLTVATTEILRQSSNLPLAFGAYSQGGVVD
jgi:hypothetical protein